MPELTNPITITLDKERHLRLTLRGMVEFEKLTGRSLLKGFQISDLPVSDVAALMWACLIHEDKELAYDTVLDMVDLTNMQPFIVAMVRCVNQSFPIQVNKRPLVGKRRPG